MATSLTDRFIRSSGTSPRSAEPQRTRSGSPSSLKDRLGTAGWAAKGVLYLLIGALAFQLALSRGAEGEQASKQGAMQSLVDKPFGGGLLLIVVIGLFAYAAYRFVTAALPASGEDDARKQLGRRVTHLGSGIAYAAFALQGVSLLLGRGSSGGGEETQRTWSAALLSSGPGTVLLLAIGIGFLAFGGYQLHKAWSRSFLEKLSCPGGSWLNRRNAERIGIVGLSARGVVAGMLGMFVVMAVWQHDPHEVRGLDGALRTIIDAPAGPAALGAVALGLAAYGAFALVSARCRRHELD